MRGDTILGSGDPPTICWQSVCLPTPHSTYITYMYRSHCLEGHSSSMDTWLNRERIQYNGCLRSMAKCFTSLHVLLVFGSCSKLLEIIYEIAYHPGQTWNIPEGNITLKFPLLMTYGIFSTNVTLYFSKSIIDLV